MSRPSPSAQTRAAERVAATSLAAVQRSTAFRQLPVGTQSAILRDLHTIRNGLGGGAGVLPASALERRPLFGGSGDAPDEGATTPAPSMAAAPRSAATDTLAARAGALSDEIDFPAFVAGLVHGTFDAILDASIRQMEAYAELVSTVARSVSDFSRDNVSRGHVYRLAVGALPRRSRPRRAARRR